MKINVDGAVRFTLDDRSETFIILPTHPDVVYYQREDGKLITAFTYEGGSWGVVVRLKVQVPRWEVALNHARELALKINEKR